jgi:hypothetical protein
MPDGTEACMEDRTREEHACGGKFSPGKRRRE